MFVLITFYYTYKLQFVRMSLNTLKRLEKTNELLAVGRKRMFDEFAAVFLVDQSGHSKSPCMLAESFFVRAERGNNIVQCRPVVICDV